MLMSGLMIFNAHPRLYWGEYGANPDPAWLEIGSDRRPRATCGSATVAVDTTGVLGGGTSTGGMPAPRLSRLGDDPLELQPGAGAALAPDLRLAASSSAIAVYWS